MNEKSVDNFMGASTPHIDKIVPPGIMRVTQHFHNLIYIRDFFIGIGQQPPEWVKREMTRVDRAIQEELDAETGQGGLLWRPKQEEKTE